MVEWLLVRHGETDWNAERRFQGQSPIPLNERGIRQAEALRIRLSEKNINAAYSSDLPRAEETARIILKNRNVPLFLCPELRELHYGSWEGLTFAEAQSQDQSLWRGLLEPTPDFSPPDGERLIDLIKRVGDFASRLREAHKEGDLLIVAHGGTLRMLLIHLLDLPLSVFWKLSISPGSLSIVKICPDRVVLKLLNDVSHYERL